MEALLFTVLALAAGVLLWRDVRRGRALRELARQMEHFLLYPDTALQESLGEGELTNLRNDAARLEELLILQQKTARRREGQMVRFTENMAHQMKNTLTGMQIELDMLEPTVTADQRRTFEKCQVCMERLTGETDRILKSSQLAEGKIPMNLEPLDLRAELEETAKRLAPLSKARDVTIKVRGPEGLMLLADPFWLPQALENVMKNAVEHTLPGTAVQVELADEGRRVRIFVSDRGPGIPAGELTELFERFHRGQTRKAGYGIGLAMARDVIAAHHGTIAASNREDGGARFQILLPVLEETRPYQ